MTAFEVFLALYLGIVAPAFGALFLSHRFRNLEAEIGQERQERREDMSRLRTEVSEVRGEISDLRREVAGLRSDLTQIALAVGARPPRTAEG